MRIAITGSSGMIGTAVAAHLKNQGHSITRILRQDTPAALNERVIRWDIPSRTIDARALAGHEVVIHLAGTNIAGHRWDSRYKEEIRSSRINGTLLISEAIARSSTPPKLLISASAVGFYGNITPPSYVDECSCMGKGFLSVVCDQWEKATKPAEVVGIRVVHMRLGLVLSAQGGALSKMLPVFRMGLGGRIGNGRQIISWIALEEIPRAIEHVIKMETLSGPVNFTAPNAVSNAQFTQALAECLSQPALLTVPAFVIRMLLGEMGGMLLLEGAKVVPNRLLESGYRFLYPEVKTALKACLRET